MVITPARRAWWEIAIVLGLSVGASAVYSLVSLTDRLTSGVPLSDQSASLNQSRSEREWLDFTYQFLGIFFELFVVALALYLLWTASASGAARIGLTFAEPGRDVRRGVVLFLAIGIPGIAFYLIGRLVGITVGIETSPLDTHWWTVPILIFSALRAALVEEVIVIGYLFTRLRERGWSDWTIILSTALLRGSYHLYQGIGPFFGNVAMGIVFGWCYRRWGRVMPLVIAHLLLDVVSFVGYPLAVGLFPEFFAVPR
ncbi:CPBP family intramembrane glutamic endopeptidase [Mycetocola zhujimingii]|uniref:CPBP family intramembrane glutamic endopeptidase n=1 Tax=Mycetocola zhujimingii TaxID=2079792 RepID=UPI000D37D06F|nr:CPBP family intramembrane glutamic endopeptidase [Mycetocola zhujimingii]AWB86886.1 CPBP family intramembrane metalloprotease domain-containing protein [Mycetocola zhujimingii]